MTGPDPSLAAGASTCAICGEANQCARAGHGVDGGETEASFDCWCLHVVIPPGALDRVPADRQGRACICPRCAGLRSEG